MMKYVLISLSLAMVLIAGDWPQGSGPEGNYIISESAPLAWSAATNKGIKWRVELPETGQSTPVIVNGKIFLTCFKPVTADSQLARDIIAMCFDASTGKLLWQKDMPGNSDSRLSGCFGDNTGTSPVSNGKHVIFCNGAGLIKCFDFDGNELWKTNIKNSQRSNPYLLGDKLIFCGSPSDLTQIKGRHITAIDFKTGKLLWKSDCYSWDGLTPMAYKRPNGEWVALVARGGGHVKDKFIEGFDLISLEDGKRKWSYPFNGFRSTQNFSLSDDKAYVFIPHGKHLTVSLEDGKLIKETNILKGAEAALNTGEGYSWGPMPAIDLKKRSIIQMSNLLVRNYHFFRTYNDNYIGRLDLKTGKTQYLQLPTQIERTDSGVTYQWKPKNLKKDKKGKSQLANMWMLKPNAIISNSGFKVVGDKRSHYSGWGHHSTALPSVAGDYIYFPTMSGLVYVIKWNAERLDEKALISISDNGKLGDSWTRSGIAFANGHAYARTIKELLCINGVKPEELSK